MRMSQRTLLSARVVSPMHPMLPDGVLNETNLPKAGDANSAQTQRAEPMTRLRRMCADYPARSSRTRSPTVFASARPCVAFIT